uniref:Kinesin motor domain-containing protein n=2 Tax=Lutzomyia longipalpis TaxID=7200 RepID=A0A1B0CNZ9_LUTLO
MLRIADNPATCDEGSVSSYLSVDKKKRQVTLSDPSQASLVAASHPSGSQERGPMVAAPKMFAFDGLFTPEDTQYDVCSAALSEVIPAVLDGSDGCLLALGYPGAGQSKSMMGSISGAGELGAIPCAISWLYRGINERRQKSGARFSVRVSALGVNATKPGSTSRDLLAAHATGQSKSMMGSISGAGELGAIPCAISWLYRGINERRQKSGARFSVRVSALGVNATKPGSTSRDLLAAHATESDESPGVYLRDDFLGGPTELRAPTAERAALFLDTALAGRASGHSSSPLEPALIFTLHVYQYSLAGKGGVAGGRSRLHLIDLGGCANRAGGLPLSGIGNVLLAILSGQRHPPNRDHPLTPLLKDCLAPITCHVTVLAHVAHTQSHTDALTTIQLASRIHRMRRRKHRFQLSGADKNLGLGSNAAGHQSGGSSEGPDPSSSDLSADTVIYMGPCDDQTDGEHPPVYLPSLSSESDESPGVYLRDDFLGGPTELRAPTAERAALFLDTALAGRASGHSSSPLEPALIFTLHVYQYSLAGKGGVAGGRSRLHLIDLGGCANRAGGLPLSGIGNVLLAILSGQRHPPNRDHPLTPLLKDCLAPITCHVTVLAHVAHTQSHTDALTTIQLASRIHRMRRRKHRFQLSGADKNLGLSSNAAGHQSGGSSEGPDPSSSDLSADTVIYMGPCDDQTDGEHPPVYLPSLSSGDNRCVMQKVLKGTMAEKPNKSPAKKAIPKQEFVAAAVNPVTAQRTESLKRNYDPGYQNTTISPVKQKIPTSPYKYPMSLNKASNVPTPKGSPMRRPNMMNSPHDSPVRKVSEEKWIDGPRVSRSKVAEARHLMREINHVKQCETWVDGPKTATQVAAKTLVAGCLPGALNPNGSYGFMDSHKKSMIRQWVENQTTQMLNSGHQLAVSSPSSPHHQRQTYHMTQFKCSRSEDDQRSLQENGAKREEEIHSDHTANTCPQPTTTTIDNQEEEDQDSGPSEVPPALPLIDRLGSREISHESLHIGSSCSRHISRENLPSVQMMDCGLQVTEEEIAKTMGSGIGTDHPLSALSHGDMSIVSSFHVGDTFSDCVIGDNSRHQFDQLARLREIFTSQLAMAEVTPVFRVGGDAGSVYSEPAYRFNGGTGSVCSEPVYRAPSPRCRDCRQSITLSRSPSQTSLPSLNGIEEDQDSGPSEVPPALPLIDRLGSREISHESLHIGSSCSRHISRENLPSVQMMDCGLQVTEEEIAKTMGSGIGTDHPLSALSHGDMSIVSSFHVGDTFSDCVIGDNSRHQFDQLARLREIFTSQLAMAEVTPVFRVGGDAGSVYSEPAYRFNGGTGSVCSEPVYRAPSPRCRDCRQSITLSRSPSQTSLPSLNGIVAIAGMEQYASLRHPDGASDPNLQKTTQLDGDDNKPPPSPAIEDECGKLLADTPLLSQTQLPQLPPLPLSTSEAYDSGHDSTPRTSKHSGISRRAESGYHSVATVRDSDESSFSSAAGSKVPPREPQKIHAKKTKRTDKSLCHWLRSPFTCTYPDTEGEVSDF